MSTLTTIQSTDLITNSRADINGNFTALNTDKEEVSNKSTDSTFASADDTTYPTTLATKKYVDAGGNVNASTTVKGIVQEATQAQINNGTATGSTGAKLFVPADKAYATALSLIPLPQGFDATIIAQPNLNSNTTAYLGQVIVPFKITVNKVSFMANGVVAAGTFDISLYSEDGQTQYFSVTTATVSGAGIITTAVSAVILIPGIYYIMINTNSTTNIVVPMWQQSGEPFGTTNGLLSDVSSEPVLRGTLAISAGTPPATFTPSSITDAVASTLICRLDN